MIYIVGDVYLYVGGYMRMWIDVSGGSWWWTSVDSHENKDINILNILDNGEVCGRVRVLEMRGINDNYMETRFQMEIEIDYIEDYLIDIPLQFYPKLNRRCILQGLCLIY